MTSEKITTQPLTTNLAGSKDEISLKELISIVGKWWIYILSKWYIIIISACVCGALGFTWASFEKTLYIASCNFVLEESGGGGLGQYAGLASVVGIDMGGGGNAGIFQSDNIIELYKSRKMMEKTLLTEVDFNGKKQLLIDRYIDFNRLRELWNKKTELKNIQFRLKQGGSFTRVQDSIITKIVDDINIRYLNVSKPDKKLSIIAVQVKSVDEFFSKEFNDNIVKNVNDFYVETKTQKAGFNVAILQRQTDSVKIVLNGALLSTASSMDVTQNLNPSRQVLRAPIQRYQFSAEANKAILTELVKDLEVAKISLRKETPLIQVIDSPIYPLETKRFGRFKAFVLAGIVGGFLITIFIVIKKIFKDIMK